MKRLAKNVTALITVCFILGLVGCTAHPVPKEAFKYCHDNGGTPAYKSTLRKTTFICVFPGDKLKNF